MNRRQVLLNAATTFAQVIGSAATLFFLYRFLVRTIGVQGLGIWSLVLATTSVVTLANQGFSASIVKFVAKYVAHQRIEEVSVLIQTTLISVALAIFAISLALYPCARWLLALVLPAGHLADALGILPYALASLWINVVGGTLLAGLAGHELITYRNYVVLGGSLLFLLMSFALVPRYGLLGLAYSQIMQSGASFLATWFLLRRKIPQLPFLPRRWDRSLFREMFSYGIQFQFITASQALREPVTKALLTKFGGLALTGFYDMASRWVFTFRELIVQANLVLVPTVSGLKERDPASIPAVYRQSYRLIFFLGIPTFAFLLVASPIVSFIWLGHSEPVFVLFVALLAAGWFVNVLSNPAYVVNLGTGALRWVSIGCAATALLNPILGFIAGKYFGGEAVVAASVFSLIVGYAIVLVSYHFENRVSFDQLLPRDSIGILVCSLAGALIFLPYFSRTRMQSLFSLRLASIGTLALLTIVVIPMWVHPMRKRLIHWVFSRLPA